ncbi:MAG: hypothetical protein QXR06_02295, partial [Candidatus Bathyarchaeia archaeon]
DKPENHLSRQNNQFLKPATPATRVQIPAAAPKIHAAFLKWGLISPCFRGLNKNAGDPGSFCAAAS